jgi:hypothetical protein
MLRIGVVLALLALTALPPAGLAALPKLTMREAHTAVSRDLDHHFRNVARVEVWGCDRRSRSAIRCYTEFHRHHPMAVCVVHYEVTRRSRGVVLAFRGLQSLFGTHCKRAAHGVKPHYHLLRHG